MLLREVPFVQEPIDLAAMQQKAKRHKDIMFAKVIAVGTPGNYSINKKIGFEVK